MKTNKKEEFIRKFIKVPAAKTGEKRQVCISEENYECLTLIAQKLSKNKIDLSEYLDNILTDHITRYGKIAIELNRERIRKELIENSLEKS